MESRSRPDLLRAGVAAEVFLGAAVTILYALLSRLVPRSDGRDAFAVLRVHRINLALGRPGGARRLHRRRRRGLAVRGLLSAAGAQNRDPGNKEDGSGSH